MDVLVVDLGSRFIRAGKADPFPNEKEPWVVTPAEAVVRDLNAPTATTAANGLDGANGGAAAAGTGRVVCPVVKGEIANWDVLEACLDHVLYDRITWGRGAEGGMLLAEPNFLSRADRERLCQLMFEVFNLAGYYGADQAVLSMYALGRSSGTVIDIGHGKIDIVPVLDGAPQLSTAVRLPYGCQQLAQQLATQLAARGISSLGSSSSSSSSSAAPGVAPALEDLARSIVRVAGSPEEAAAAAEPTTHTLPDGQTITIQGEGQQLGEALMDGSRLGLDVAALSEAVYTAATAQGDKDTRKAWLEGMMVCGGGSSAPGLGGRLLKEVRGLTTQQITPLLCSLPEYMPEGTLRHAAWMGGAVLARVAFSQAGGFITKADYEEQGPAAVLKKCV
ncbi:Actin-related protein 7 [Chlorella vulgaris]